MIMAQLISNAIDNTMDLLKKDFASTYKGLLKIQILAAAALVVPLAAILVLYGISLYGAISLNMAATGAIATIFLAIVAIGILFIAIFISGAISSTGYNFIDSRYKKSPFDIIEQAKTNFAPYIFYVIVRFLITIIILAPFYIVAFGVSFVGAFNPVAAIFTGLLGFVVRIIAAIVGAILALFIQFAIFEVLIAKNDVIESFKRSFNLVKNNFLETFLFSLLLWIVVAIISVVTIIFTLVIALGLALAMGIVLGSSLGTSSIIMWAGIAIAVLIGISIFLALSVLQNLIEIPAQYNYWKELTKSSKSNTHG
jgi:hypothetical protein